MPDYRRYYIPDAIVFITCVTRDRIPYLRRKEDLSLFWETLRRVQQQHPFRLLAFIILPDHFHWLMRVDDPEGNFSTIMHSIKRTIRSISRRHLFILFVIVNFGLNILKILYHFNPFIGFYIFCEMP